MKKFIFFLALLSLCASAQIMQQVVGSSTVAAPLYYGYGCNGTSTNTCTVATTQQGLANYIISYMITTGSNAAGYSVISGGVSVNNADGASAHNLQIGILSDTTTGCGGALTHCGSASICNSASVSVAAGAAKAWVEAVPSSCPTLTANTNYWVAVEYDNSNLSYYNNATGASAFYALTFGNWSVLASNWTASTNSYSMYVKVSPK